MLIDLQHQVKFGELPWVQAVSSHRSGNTGMESADAARRLATLALQHFPHTITPNPLVQELDMLMRLQRNRLPFVEELAADIFIGSFSSKFLAAAKVAGEQLRDTLYARYYGIDYDYVLSIDDLGKKHGAMTSKEFDDLCESRAEGKNGTWKPAANGTIIEQAQIITTHNLATIWGPLGVGNELGDDAGDLAMKAFEHVCRGANRAYRNKRPLGKIKDSAYAWRQMIFYMSMLSKDEQTKFVNNVRNVLERQPDHVKCGVTLALPGLDQAIDGASDPTSQKFNNADRFVGWTTSRHWLLDAINS